MATAGIIAEYNPFHSGHRYHLAETRRRAGGSVVCVISGNWVQRGEPALVSKWVRARMALEGGADLVLELPTPWAMASAERFGRGGVEVLAAAGVVEVLSFGSEDGRLEPLQKAADCLDAAEYRTALGSFLRQGITFAAARQQAAEALGADGACLRGANNNLGVEYLRAIRATGSALRPMTVPRKGAGHLDREAREGMASASLIRSRIFAGDWNGAEQFLSEGDKLLLLSEQEGGRCPAQGANCGRAVLARLRGMTPADWARLPDSGAAEGLPDRMAKAAGQAASVEEFLTLAKTKRYPLARLRRLMWYAFLGLEEDLIPDHVPYLRVLGLGPGGRALLREMREKARLPVLLRPAQGRALGGEAAKLLELERRCTDLYALTLPEPVRPGWDWTAGPVILEA